MCIRDSLKGALSISFMYTKILIAPVTLQEILLEQINKKLQYIFLYFKLEQNCSKTETEHTNNVYTENT